MVILLFGTKAFPDHLWIILVRPPDFDSIEACCQQVACGSLYNWSLIEIPHKLSISFQHCCRVTLGCQLEVCLIVCGVVLIAYVSKLVEYQLGPSYDNHVYHHSAHYQRGNNCRRMQ